MKRNVPALLVAGLFGLAVIGCDQKPADKKAADKKADTHSHKDGDGHDHKDGDGHDHKSEKKDDGHGHGPTVALGDQNAGAFKVQASRGGAVEAGKEASFDLTITGGTPSAVRVWVGVESGEGSAKAKADKEGERWHGHTDAPSPLPAGSKLWVEVENDKGEKSLASFDLKL